MKKLILIMIMTIYSYANINMDNINFIIKTKSLNESLIENYSKYDLIDLKEVLIFMENNNYEKDFVSIYEQLNEEDKFFILMTLNENLERFDSIIKELDLFNRYFVYTDNMKEQEFQFKFFNLLLNDKRNKFYTKCLLNSNVMYHNKTIFNPYNVINIDKRYQYFIKRFFDNAVPISYINSLEYLVLPIDYKTSLSLLGGFDREYRSSIIKYSKMDEKVIAPIFINTIFYDRADTHKSINVNHSFVIEGKISNIINILENKESNLKLNHDILKSYLENKKIDKLELEDYLRNIKFDVNVIKILNDSYDYFEVFDGVRMKKYDSLEKFLEENTTTYIY